ncbi:unnamed protein product [Amoebophrya sp. A25]|nr:unnamed protein product [Amoebophrya sp. A25]|eukprot:GSA25T00016346001.1
MKGFSLLQAMGMFLKDNIKMPPCGPCPNPARSVSRNINRVIETEAVRSELLIPADATGLKLGSTTGMMNINWPPESSMKTLYRNSKMR